MGGMYNVGPSEENGSQKGKRDVSLGGFHKGGYPKMDGLYGNTLKMDDLGVPPLNGPPHLKIYLCQ